MPLVRYAPEKTVPIPPFGRTDISEYLPLINSAPFQRLKYKTQLSLVKEVFPGATHSRYLHSLAVMDTTRKILRSMISRGFFPKEDQQQLERDLCVAALVHDIGHPAYSHMAEYVLAALSSNHLNHNTVGENIIMEEAAEAIIACGSAPERVKAILDKKSPSLGRLITAKSIGADKLAYLFQDQHMAGYDAVAPPGSVDSFVFYITPVGEHIGAEEKAEDLLKSLQRFYFEMYTHVYLRKQCLAVGRMLQKALEFHLRESETDPMEVWHQREGWIDTQLEDSPNLVARRLYERITLRDIVKAAIVYKPERYTTAERLAGKSIAVLPLSESEQTQLLHTLSSPLALTSLERRLAEAYTLPQSGVIVTIVPDPKKLVPEDIFLVDNAGNARGTLFQRLPRFHEGLQEEAEAFFSIRILVSEEHRAQVASKPFPVSELLAD